MFVGFLLGGLVWGFVSDLIGRKWVSESLQAFVYMLFCETLRLVRTHASIVDFQGLLIVDLLLLVFGVLSAVPVSPDDAKIPGFPWLLICRFGVGFGAGGTAQA